MVWRASVVLELGLNAYCVWEMILCSVRWSISWLLMSVSRSLAMLGRREMGRWLVVCGLWLDLDHFRDLEWVWVDVFVDRGVEKFA